VSDSPAAIPMLPDGGELRLSRSFAILQVALIWVVPTQVLVGSILAFGTGIQVLRGEQLTFEFFAMLSLLDTAVVALLIRLFLSLSGETSREVFLGPMPAFGEIVRGLLFVPVVSMVVALIVLGLRAFVPWTHNVDQNPLGEFVQTPIDAAIFFVVVVLAGGIREELQRAFILHRFGQRLWSMKLGLVLFSVFFGAMHVNQGYDAAIAVGTLGVFWGLLYLWRRSAVMAMVNHAGFNAVQVLVLVLGSKTFGA
jgi:membrane protease YdiL (CAAX protease family)